MRCKPQEGACQRRSAPARPVTLRGHRPAERVSGRELGPAAHLSGEELGREVIINYLVARATRCRGGSLRDRQVAETTVSAASGAQQGDTATLSLLRECFLMSQLLLLGCPTKEWWVWLVVRDDARHPLKDNLVRIEELLELLENRLVSTSTDTCSVGDSGRPMGDACSRDGQAWPILVHGHRRIDDAQDELAVDLLGRVRAHGSDPFLW